MYIEKGNSGLCEMQWATAEKIGRPVIILTDLFMDTYVKSIQGRDYPQVAGLIKVARDAAYVPIQTVMIQSPMPANDQMVIWQAKVWDPYSQDWWIAHADCTPGNVSNPKLAKSFVRIGETRAIGRDLRFALGIDMVCFEELSDLEDEKPQTARMEMPRQVGATATNPVPVQPAAQKAESNDGPAVSDETLSKIAYLVDVDRVATWTEVREYAVTNFNKSRRADLTEKQALEAITWLESLAVKDVQTA